MKRREPSRTLSRQKRLAKAAARDRVDELVHKIVRRLKQGKPVDVPGLGTLMPRKSQ